MRPLLSVHLKLFDDIGDSLGERAKVCQFHTSVHPNDLLVYDSMRLFQRHGRDIHSEIVDQEF